MHHENSSQTPHAEESQYSKPEVHASFEQPIRPLRLSLAGLRGVWHRLRGVEQQTRPERTESSGILGEQVSQGAVSEEIASITEPETENIETAPKPVTVALFENLIDTQALITERKYLAIDFGNRTSDWIRRQLAGARSKLAEAEESRNMDRARIERQRVNELETFTDERYSIGERLNYMNQNRAALMMHPADERATALLASLAATELPVQQRFIGQQKLDEAMSDVGQRIFIDRGRHDEPIRLPVHNFVSAYGMQSWEGGRKRGVLKENDEGKVLQSAEIIADYAQRTTQAPPIERVHAYIQPNGIALYATEGGSHRTAAAVLRGDQAIQANSLIVHQIATNFVNVEVSSGPDETTSGDYELPEPSMMH